MKRIFHISDLHFGPPFLDEACRAILAHAESGKFNAIVVTGDLTQRARPDQFERAAKFLTALRKFTGVMVVPGNHDIPLYRFWERLLSPYKLFRSHVSDTNSAYREEGLTVVGLDTTHPYFRISGGRLGKSAIAFARKTLEGGDLSDARVVAMHHPLLSEPQANHIVDLFLEWGVSLVLCGHAHFSGATKIEDKRGRSLVLCQSGTSTSSRGRGTEMGINSANEIYFDDSALTVRSLQYTAEKKSFEQIEEKAFSRT